MRHRRLRRKLGVKTNHRKALLRNLVRNLVIRKRIRTTYAKAKEASAFADRMVQLAKRGEDLHARRLLIARLACPDTADTLIRQIAPLFKERQGGYTRVLRLGYRPGDGAETALLEFTTVIEAPPKPRKLKKEKKAERDEEKIFQTRQTEDKSEAKEKEKEKEEKKPPESREKKESEKKGGFLGALRRFLKGDDQGR